MSKERHAAQASYFFEYLINKVVMKRAINVLNLRNAFVLRLYECYKSLEKKTEQY